MPWNKIDNLLKKTEAFYKKALWAGLLAEAQVNHRDTNAAEPDYSGGYVSPDDESPESEAPESLEPESVARPGEDLGLYSGLKSFARDITNPDIAEEIELIGELYKKTLREGKGFAYVANAINNLVGNSIPDNYPEDEDEEDDDEDSALTPEKSLKRERDSIERFMTKVYTDVKLRAAKAGVDVKKKDDPNVARQMHEFKNSYLEKREQQLASKMGPGATVERDLTQEELDELKDGGGFDNSLDRADIAGKREREGGGATPGMSMRQGYNPKDWAAFYKGEIDRYNDELRSNNDPNIQANLQEMVRVLEGLYKLTKDESLLSESITWTVRPKTEVSPRQKVIDQPELKETYEKVKTAQKELRKKRVSLNTRLRAYKANKENQNLTEQISASTSPKEKFLLEQKRLLNEVIMSTDKRKTLELKRRKQLVKSLGGNIDPEEVAKNPEVVLPSYPVAQLEKDLAKIKEASGLRITSYESNVEQANKIKKEFNYYGSMRGEPISVEGIFIQFTQSIPSIKMGIKKKITAEFRESKNTTYNPYREAISAALQSGNAAAVTAAEKAFQKKLNNDAEEHPAIKSFVIYSTGFTKYLEQLKVLHKEESKTEENGKVLLSSTNIDLINQLYEDGKKLHALEMIRNPGFGRKGPSNAAKALEIIIRQLSERVAAHRNVRVAPDTQVRVAPGVGQEEELQDEVIDQPALKQQVIKGFNHMTIKQKLAALQEALRKEELMKLAQENDVNFYAETPEQLGGELPVTGMSKEEADAQADNIMNNIIDNLKIKGLDY